MEHRIGVVLSGGGIRGAAHVGVLQALDEAGIRPDCISGTSAGALVGALYGAGRTSEEMLDFFERIKPFRASRLAFRKPGLTDSDRYLQEFERCFPEDSFESLGVRLFVTATDMANARLEIFTSGPLIKPLIASSAIPIFVSPVEFAGLQLSDGGILNNFPLEPLKVLCDCIIGVYASALPVAKDFKLKSSLAVSQRALEVGMFNSSKPKFRECDMLLAPPELANFGPFETKKRQEIYEIGYRATIDRMDTIKERLRAKGCL